MHASDPIKHYRISDLDVIGYIRPIHPGAEVLPVYKVARTERVLMPPFIYREDGIVGASVTDLEAFNRDCAAKRCVSMQPLPAKIGHVLALRGSGALYGPESAFCQPQTFELREQAI